MVAERKLELLELLMNEKVTTVVLVGESGIGKTWMARQISNSAMNKGLFDITLWVFLCRGYNNLTLSECIAHQLCLFSDSRESAAVNENEESKRESSESLHQKMSEALAGKKFLLILDDEGNKMTEQQIMSELESVLNLKQRSSFKVLITSRSAHDSSDGERSVIVVEPLPMEESLSLLRQRAETGVFQNPGFVALAEIFIQKTKGVPTAIILMAKAFSYFSKHDSGLQMLKKSLEDASDRESYDIKWLLHTGYDLLPRSILIDFCWGGSHFFHDRGIHYNELIAYWMMEGYLGHIDQINKAYKLAHHVLMELIECGMLKKMEADYVFMERPRMNLEDIILEGPMRKGDTLRASGFGGTANLGLMKVFGNVEWEGFGEITHVDGIGMMKSCRSGKDGQEVSTLLLDGYYLSGEGPHDFFLYRQLLKVLAIFNPTFTSLSHLAMLKKLCVLMLRGCYFLHNIESGHFQNLNVLEISGASSVTTIPDDLFIRNPRLQSLNLSGMGIDELPSSLYDLRELRWLILSECSRLKTLRSLENLGDLIVLDLFGATSLEYCENKSFHMNLNLQILNLSQTKIEVLPRLTDNTELTHLLLSGCTKLDRLRKIWSLKKLQILDLSDSCSCTIFQDEFSTVDGLNDFLTLDLSKTQVRTLPFISNLSNLRRLLLSGCLKLQDLPDLNLLKNLEVLDISGCASLKTLQDNSFEQMSRLQILNLSETNISFLPKLANLSNLRHLLLEGCNSLKAIPGLEFLTQLEELNLRGIGSLTGADFLKHMNCLQILDLSETLLEQLPSLSNLKELRQLSLRGCSSLTAVPDLEALTKLELLDLSGTAMTHMPNLKNLIHLRDLQLRDCSGLEEFQNLEMLDLAGTTFFKELPYGISELTQLDHFVLPNVMNTKVVESGKPKDLGRSDWFVSGLKGETSRDSNNSLVPLSHTQFVHLLEVNPSLWDTGLKRFHLSVHPLEEPCRKGVGFLHGDPSMVKDVYFQNTHFSEYKEQRSLEIRGFYFFPEDIGDILAHTDCLFLIDNAFMRCLSDLGGSNFEVVKGCCIDRCSRLETVFRADTPGDNTKWGRSLEILVVINALKLMSIYDGNHQCEALRNLKHLYLDSCPMLSYVLYAPQLVNNLKTLQIEFCDKLESVFEQASSEARLPNLEILHLWELPELKKVGCKLPSLRVLKVWGCPKLSKLEEILQSAKLLEVLVVSRVTDLKIIYTEKLHPESLKNLKSMTLDSCPMLVNVFSSSHPAENIETLRIKSCANLKTVFEQHTSADHTLPKLHTLHLQELPKLERLGVKLPSTQNASILKCPNCRAFLSEESGQGF